MIVKHFSGSTTEYMKTYIQSPLMRDPDRVIIHVGTNDLRSSQDPETIAKNIIDIAKSSTSISHSSEARQSEWQRSSSK